MMMIRTSIILILLAGVSLGEKLRGLETVKDIKPIPCNKGTSGMNCVCPGGCLTYYNSTDGCHPNNCWKWYLASLPKPPVYSLSTYTDLNFLS